MNETRVNLLAELLLKEKCRKEGKEYVPFIERNKIIQSVNKQSEAAKRLVFDASNPEQFRHTETSIPSDNNIISLSDNKTCESGEVQENETNEIVTDKYGNTITYNSKQQEFITLAASGKSCVLLGAAGTGKTTCQKGILQEFIESESLGYLDCSDHNYLPKESNTYPGIVITAFTRRAVANIKRNMPDLVKPLCITIHKLLEYQPIKYTITDPNTGLDKETMRFEATRNKFNPLPSSIKTIIVEESSMVSVELEREIKEALDHEVQFIYLGDIQQLPPVFGAAVLGFKMLSLPVVELTEVYRQALESPIIKLAHRILSGVPIKASEFKDWHVKGKLTIHPWAKKIHADNAVIRIGMFFTSALDSGAYNPREDMILIPFNKALGTLDVNKYIAQHIARKENKLVHHIIAGFESHYFSVGDKVLYDKEDAEIISITPNRTYTGKRTMPASLTLDYFGQETGTTKTVQSKEEEDAEIADIDLMLENMAGMGFGDDEEKVNSASHVIKLRMLDTEREIEVSTAADINAMLLGYAMTVHKSQGSEWRKVFLVLHQSHATMIQRELLYTAVTRPREELYIICEPDTFEKGIIGQRIKGNSLAEKAEFFKGKVDSGNYKLT